MFTLLKLIPFFLGKAELPPPLPPCGIALNGVLRLKGGGVVTRSWKRKFGEKTIRKRELKLKMQREAGIEAKMQRDEGRSI